MTVLKEETGRAAEKPARTTFLKRLYHAKRADTKFELVMFICQFLVAKSAHLSFPATTRDKRDRTADTAVVLAVEAAAFAIPPGRVERVAGVT